MYRIVPMLFAVSVLLLSCNGNDRDTTSENKDPGMVDSIGNGQTSINNVSNDEDEFIADAYYDGLKEIEAGRIAKQKAQSREARELADMMVQDHTAMGEKLKSLAASKNISLRDSLSTDDRDDLRNNKKTGKEFDRWYTAEMVEDHEEAVSDFDKQSKDAKDPQIKVLATEALPKLQHHLEMAKAARDKVKG